MINPFGVIYNPISIHQAVSYAVRNELPADHTYLENDGLQLNYEFHSEVGAYEKNELISTLTSLISSSHTFLKQASCIFITYGTSWVYERIDTNEIVANCHKIPPHRFNKRLLTQNEIIQSFEIFYQQLKTFNPGIRIILTVSPVRHLKDTLELNSVSKAVLRTACHLLSTQFNDVEYFPAFEIMIDDLRDYRFYKSDMLHPTDDAEDYIWNRFTEKYFDDDTQKFIKEWKSVLAAIQHRPFHPSSPAHQRFLEETIKKLERLKDKVNIDHELQLLKEQQIV
jgi:lysophospholipase L1-like esterase